MSFASAAPPAWIAAAVSRSARGNSHSHTAPLAARTSSSESGSRSESRLRVARRTTTCISSRSSDAASSAATRPRSRRNLVAAARFRRTSPYSGCANLASTRSPTWSRAMRPRMSACSTAAGSVIRVSDPSSMGSPTARASITSLTELGRPPIRPSTSSIRLGGKTGSPNQRQQSSCIASRSSATSCSTMLRRYNGLPRVNVHNRSAACGSTGPPNVAEMSAVVSASDNG